MLEAPPHPDRVAPTLAVRRLLLETVGDGPFQAPGPGSSDARIDLKLLMFRARRALATSGTVDAADRFAAIDSPDLLAGTVQDATARGVCSALEDVISLCRDPEPVTPEDAPLDDDVVAFEGRELRRKKDILVASGGGRIRWSRKGGVLFVDRAHDVHETDCIRFEDRKDLGDLDGFVGDPDERPRLFSPAYLKPETFAQGERTARLVLAGRLGRTAQGLPCRVVFIGRRDEPWVHMVVHVHNEHEDHRLRVRFVGCRNPRAIDSDGTPGFTLVRHKRHWFVAATLVRACARLRVGDDSVATPSAQCRGWIRHEFRLGGTPWKSDDVTPPS